MSTAKDAVADAVTKRRQAVAQLARAPRIPIRRPKDAPPASVKHAAVVLRRGMSQQEFRQLESQLSAHGLAFLPVLPGQRRAALANTPVCGLIITGGDQAPTSEEQHMIVSAINEALERKAPVLALSDAIGLALDACGLDAPAEQGCAILIHNGVRALPTRREVDEVIKQMSATQAR